MKLTKEFLTKKYLDERLSFNDINRLTGISLGAIHYWMKYYNIKVRNLSDATSEARRKKYLIRRKDIPHKNIEELKRLYFDELLNTHQIGKMYGVSNATIIRTFNEFGVKLRTNADAKSLGKNGFIRDDEDRKKDNIIRTARWKKWRNSIYDRDNYCCKMCGSKNKIVAHHIIPRRDFPELMFSINNGITICNVCHGKVNYNEYLFVKELIRLIRKSGEFRETPINKIGQS